MWMLLYLPPFCVSAGKMMQWYVLEDSSFQFLSGFANTLRVSMNTSISQLKIRQLLSASGCLIGQGVVILQGCLLLSSGSSTTSHLVRKSTKALAYLTEGVRG